MGDRAYCGVGWSGFYILDLQSPTNPIVLARHESQGQVYDLWVDGNYAFVAEGWAGLAIVDISRPGETFAVETVPTRGEARAVEVANNYIYLAEAGGGLTILALPTAAVTILEQPASISAVLGGEAILRVRAFGREALSYQWFLGQSGDTSRPIPGATGPSLTIAETSELAAYWVRVSGTSAVSNSQTAWVKPVAPVSVELLTLWPGYRRGSASDLEVRGNLVYVAAGALQIWDVANPAAPRVVGSYDPGGSEIYDICFSGNSLTLLACEANRLEIVNIDNPAAPYRAGAYTNDYGVVTSVIMSGQNAYCLCGSTLVVLNLSDPSRPRELSALELDSWGGNITVQGSLLYFANSSIGLKIIDITNPSQPSAVSTLAMAGYPRKVAVEGNYACIAEEKRWLENNVTVGGGLVIVDVSIPTTPRLLGRWSTDYAQDVFVTNSIAWLADGSAGLKAFDLRNPAYPELIGTYASSEAYCIKVSSQRAFTGTAYSRVQVLDISNPATPTPLGFLQTGGYSRSVAVAGGYAYLADDNCGVRILDITDPRKPVAVGSYTNAGAPEGLVVSGQHLFLAPFEIVSLADPEQPVQIGTLNGDNYATDLALLGNTVCLSSSGDLKTIDVSNPAAPTTLARVAINNAFGIATGHDLACVACGWDGLMVFDLTAPTNPRKVASYISENEVRDVAVDGNCAYLVMAGKPGLERLDLSDPRRPALTSAIPLPGPAKVAPMDGSYACVAGAGLQVVDFGDPAHPVCVGRHPLAIGASGLQVVGDLAFVAAGDYGLAIYRLTPQLMLHRPVFDGTDLRLSWLGSPGVRLQRTASLSNSDWQDVPNSDGASALRLPASSATGFYRLVRK